MPKATVRQVTLGPGEQATHQTKSGRFVTLTCEPPGVEMELEDAYMFLADPAWEVRDEDGKVIKNIEKADNSDGRVTLKPGQIIVEMEELTRAALFTRCKMCPRSEDLNSSTSKDDLIAFLMERQRNERLGIFDVGEDYTAEVEDGEMVTGEALTESVPLKDMDEMLEGVKVVETT